jgi:putative ATPase
LARVGSKVGLISKKASALTFSSHVSSGEPTSSSKKAKDYKYAHDYYKDMPIEDPERPPAMQLQEYLPESLKGRRYYEPGQQGKEAGIKKWLERRRGEESE